MSKACVTIFDPLRPLYSLLNPAGDNDFKLNYYISNLLYLDHFKITMYLCNALKINVNCEYFNAYL